MVHRLSEGRKMAKILLKASVVSFMVGMGIMATSAVLYGLKVFTIRQTMELFCMGMSFGVVGSVLRAIHINIVNRRR